MKGHTPIQTGSYEIFPDETIVVWFSCGAASAVAAKRTIERYGQMCNVRVVNNPVAEEDADNQRFMKDVEKWLGVKIETAKNRKFPNASAVEVWDKRKFMSGPHGAPCTIELKKEARYEFEKDNEIHWHVLGFTKDEENRHDRFVLGERENVIPVLIEDGLSKKDCFKILQQAGIDLPRIYKMGYPNANCIGCVKATSPTYWNHVRKMHPDIYSDRDNQSRQYGAKLVRCHPRYLSFCSKHDDGEWWDDRTDFCLHVTDPKTGKRKLVSPRIFLDELPVSAKGASMKTMTVECGIFCEEKP